MSIQIIITDPTRDEALRMADYLFALAGYGKKDGIVSHTFKTTPAQVGEQLKSHVESMARTPAASINSSTGQTTGTLQTTDDDSTGVTHAPSSAATSVGAPPPPSAIPKGILADSAGHAWDERIHASSHAVVSDGTWRLRRNLDPAVLEAVLAERAANASHGSAELDADAVKLNAMVGPGTAGVTFNDVGLPPPAPGAWPFPSDTAATGTDTGTTLAPAASVGVPPPPPATSLTFAAFMQRVTAAIGAGTIAQTDVSAALAAENVASIPLLASVHADKIDAIAARLGV